MVTPFCLGDPRLPHQPRYLYRRSVSSCSNASRQRRPVEGRLWSYGLQDAEELGVYVLPVLPNRCFGSTHCDCVASIDGSMDSRVVEDLRGGALELESEVAVQG